MKFYYKQLFLSLNSRLVRNLFIISFYLLIFVSGDGICQVNPSAGKNRWSISLNPCINRSAVINTKFSSIPFRGITAGIGGFIKYQRPLAEHELHVFYTQGDNETNSTPLYNLNQTIFNIDYGNLYSIYSSANNLLECKVGGIIQLFYAGRVYNGFINQNHSFESALSFGGNIKLIFNLPGKLSGFAITNRLAIPLVFGYSTPDNLKNAMDSPGSKTNSAIDYLFTYTRLGGIGKLLKIKNFISIERTLNPKNLLALTYNWDYYNIETASKVNAANHQLGISYRYEF